jgi:hypothetical protein
MEKSRKKNVKSSFVNYLVKRVFLRLKAHYSIGVAFSLRILFFYISRRISNMGLLCSYDDQHII